MKIGIVNYSDLSTVDIASLLRTFSIAKKVKPDASFGCKVVSYRALESETKTIFIQPDQIGESLSDFDIIVLPGAEDLHQEDLDFQWTTWLKSSNPDARYYGFNQGADLLNYLKIENQWMQNDYKPLYGFFVGLEILGQSLSWSEINQVAKALSIQSEWSSFQQSRTPRVARISRKTAETEINLELGLDGTGKSKIHTSIPFLDHMINQISKHGLFDLDLEAKGDLEVDAHHTMEDCGIILGDAFRQALGDKKGINRMASATIPMDESLATVTLDFSARPYFVIQSKFQFHYSNISWNLLPWRLAPIYLSRCMQVKITIT